MTSQTKKNQPQDVEISREQLDELKRDMRTAHLAAWAEKNQKALIVSAVVLLAVIAGAGLWREHVATRRSSAATLYQQALIAADAESKRSLLEKVVRDYNSTAYGGLAELLLAKVDQEHAVQRLQALLSRSGLGREIALQARLDLAQAYLRKGDKTRARGILAQRMGKHYEQLRHYLLALAADTDTDRIAHLEQALDAVSHDAMLKRRIEKRLAELSPSSARRAADDAGSVPAE